MKLNQCRDSVKTETGKVWAFEVKSLFVSGRKVWLRSFLICRVMVCLACRTALMIQRLFWGGLRVTWVISRAWRYCGRGMSITLVLPACLQEPTLPRICPADGGCLVKNWLLMVVRSSLNRRRGSQAATWKSLIQLRWKQTSSTVHYKTKKWQLIVYQNRFQAYPI